MSIIVLARGLVLLVSIPINFSISIPPAYSGDERNPVTITKVTKMFAEYALSGLEYSYQCFCGDVIPSDRAPIPSLIGNCAMPCSGDSKETCGGASLISLYQKCGDGARPCVNIKLPYINGTASATSSGSDSTSTVSASGHSIIEHSHSVHSTHHHSPPYSTTHSLGAVATRSPVVV